MAEGALQRGLKGCKGRESVATRKDGFWLGLCSRQPGKQWRERGNRGTGGGWLFSRRGRKVGGRVASSGGEPGGWGREGLGDGRQVDGCGLPAAARRARLRVGAGAGAGAAAAGGRHPLHLQIRIGCQQLVHRKRLDPRLVQRQRLRVSVWVCSEGRRRRERRARAAAASRSRAVRPMQAGDLQRAVGAEPARQRLAAQACHAPAGRPGSPAPRRCCW